MGISFCIFLLNKIVAIRMCWTKNNPNKAILKTDYEKSIFYHETVSVVGINEGDLKREGKGLIK